MSWFTKYGWDGNPFTVLPDPHYMTGFEEIRRQITGHVSSNSMCLLTGATGAGKTTILLWLKDFGLRGFRPVYVNGLDYQGFDLNRLHRRTWSILARAFGVRTRVVLLVDECQNLKTDFAEAIKARWDIGEVFSVVLASIDEEPKNLTPSMQDRVGYRKVRLRPLSEEECFELVRRRLDGKLAPWASGFLMTFAFPSARKSSSSS